MEILGDGWGMMTLVGWEASLSTVSWLTFEFSSRLLGNTIICCWPAFCSGVGLTTNFFIAGFATSTSMLELVEVNSLTELVLAHLALNSLKSDVILRHLLSTHRCLCATT